ncbi:UNVERIFIED_CONTAM: hypothetical protein Sradi_0417900 [Sesamum radiatum]|uniref:Uncharacterized protein n=1 Tax=Sesamum radiatum TaxID=300843 RepID=A0AAW2WAD5_SESRA
MAATVCELRWISYVLSDFGISVPLPIRLFCDNQAALHIMANPLADLFTKILPLKSFADLVSKLGLFSMAPTPTCGGAVEIGDADDAAGAIFAINTNLKEAGDILDAG